MRRLVLVVAVLLVAALVPSVAAHEGDHGKIRIAAPDAARVGETVTLTYYVYEDGGLVGHVDTDVTLTLNGRPLVQLGSTHEHDGIHHLHVRFPRSGDFALTVTAEIDGEPVLARHEGVVEPAGDLHDVDVQLEGPSTVLAGEAATFTVAGEVQGDGDHDHGGLAHVDGWVRVHRAADHRLVRRSPLHIHHGDASFRVGPRIPGDYTVRVELHPSGDGPSFAPVVREVPLTVRAPGGQDPDRPVLPPAMEMVPGDQEHLKVGVDPTTTVGPQTDVRLNAVWLDDGDARPHIDYAYELTGPDGAVLMATDAAHRHNGFAEIQAHTPVPGTYTFRVQASPKDADVTETAQVQYTVVPPTEAASSAPGSVSLAVDGDLRTGEVQPLKLVFEDAAGEPMEHIEADMALIRDGEATPLWSTKLHTHRRDVAFGPAFRAPGSHVLDVHPSPQSPSAQVIVGPDGPGEPVAFGLDVAGEAVPVPGPDVSDAGPSGAALPGFAAWTVAAAVIGGLALLARRP